jgi:hypothetical protein
MVSLCYMHGGTALTHAVQEAKIAQQSLYYYLLDASPDNHLAEGAKTQIQHLAGFSCTTMYACLHNLSLRILEFEVAYQFFPVVEHGFRLLGRRAVLLLPVEPGGG